jgi:flavin reductase (DIM6/NTAB) family NADH-FMN oxidoreductase RutF
MHCSRAGQSKALYPGWLLERTEAFDSPALRNSLAFLDCEVARAHEEYTHTVFIGNVRRVWLGCEGDPLIYIAGMYRRLGGASLRDLEVLWDQLAFRYP